jgi:acyl carrier protein
MDKNSITQQVRDIVRIKLDIQDIYAEQEITSEANFANDLGADSLDTAELVMEFEKTFNIAISDSEWEDISTFGEAVALIEKKLELR